MTDQTTWLKNELEKVRKELDLKNEENQALYFEIKRKDEMHEAHQKYNGELNLKITGLEQTISDMKKEEKEMLSYP